jgi:hypothetical protein
MNDNQDFLSPAVAAEPTLRSSPGTFKRKLVEEDDTADSILN